MSVAGDADGEQPGKVSQRNKASATLRLLTAGTIVYVVALLLILTQTDRCDPSEQYTPATWLAALIGDLLRCRSINELGDFLAGAFAPLAFIWLAGAVFLQSRELEETRSVLAEQAEESRATRVFIGEQTDILRRGNKAREEKEADEELDQMVRAVVLGKIGARELRGERLALDLNMKRNWQKENWPVLSSFTGYPSAYEAFDAMGQNIAHIATLLNNAKEYRLARDQGLPIHELVTAIRELKNIAARTSAAKKPAVLGLRLDAIALLLDRIEEHGDRIDKIYAQLDDEQAGP